MCYVCEWILEYALSHAYKHYLHVAMDMYVRERKRACLRGKLSLGGVNGSSVGRLCHNPSLLLFE